MSKKNSLENKRARQAVGTIPFGYSPFYQTVYSDNNKYSKLVKANKASNPKYVTINTLYLGMVAQILGLKV